MNNQDFDTIVSQITSGLTGDPAKDIPYLKKQCEFYKDHELSLEILRACGRLLYDILPDDQKSDISRIYDNEVAGIRSVLEVVRFNIYEEKLDNALKLMEGLVEKIDAAPAFEDDETSEYHTFDEPFEELLYVFTKKPQKTIRRAPIPYAEIYFQYGSLLFELKRFDEARAYLEKAMEWDPTNARIAFEHAETYKVQEDLEKTEELTKAIFRIAFKPADLAHCYRNMGYIFVEKEMVREAVACYYMSMQYDPDAAAVQSELFYIQQVFEVEVTPPTLEEIKEIAERCDIPLGADRHVLGIAYSFGKKHLEEKEYEGAEYFLRIAYDLTNDEEIAKMLEFIPSYDEKLN